MNLGKTDIVIGMSMSVAVIFMSFTFPALGLTGENVQESEIPDFNISKGAAEFAREEPQYPNRPSQGELRYVNGSADWEDNRQVYLQRGSPEYLISFFDDSASGNEPEWKLNLIKFNSSGSYAESTTITENETKELTSVDGQYKVGFTDLNVENDTVGSEVATVNWEVIEQPSDQSWLGRLPVVGSIISGANQLAAVVGWIASILWYFTTQILVTIANTLLMFYNVFAYGVDFMVWLITTYGSIISGAPTSWASVIVAIPGILLSFEFMKVIAIAIKLLPLT